MAKDEIAPEQMFAAAFEGKSEIETKRLLARLEQGGAAIYRAFAASERNTSAREALLAAADREEQNAGLLRLMTEPKTECGRCQTSLPLGSQAYCCSFQCTFCGDCTAQYQNVCPNCGGQLEIRA